MQLFEIPTGWRLAALIVAWTAAVAMGFARHKRPVAVLSIATLALLAAWPGAVGGAMTLNRLTAATTMPTAHRWSLDGALIAALLAGWSSAKLLRVDPLRVADLFAPAAALGIALARWECFRQGCCYGRPTSAPWGVEPAWGSPAQQEYLVGHPTALFTAAPAVHPTQLYELVVALLLAAGAVAGELRGRRPPGEIAAMTWTGFAAWRLAGDALRSPSTLALPWIAVLHASACAAGIVAWRRCRRGGASVRTLP